ncbi:MULTISPECIES: acyltransferase [unclassified Mesorhizobium]|uniref:acyltransferase family protein n=1 Tax=unclassified Mesorhizobium TaxID=325217 RepID=UPI000BAF2185|nr:MULTISPECIES: acyltransferase [unclassified Mesorhizobium]PBB23920.1 exopolysaccharide production protein exoz [Mesorhizobium sp. WSM4304]PBB72919.1 exopolysaccharide production protein exoz [Mesorhizobium sp. WSM4308]TRC78502.1 acyltransferase [Mesorhizobium sp. WSM4310]
MLYQNIQGLRAVAALMVVCAHFYYSPWVQPVINAVGPGGVDVFFVISGFVVFLSAARIGKKAAVVGRWRAFREFAVKRVFRIYPVYWVAFAVASIVLLTTTVSLAPADLAQKPWWKLFLLIAQPNNRILAAWTLQYEMIFYSVCALAILLFPRRVLIVLAAWFAIVFAIWAAGISWHSYYVVPAIYFFIPVVLEFFFGIVVALMAERKIAGYAFSSVVAGVCGLLFGAYVLSQNGGYAASSMWRTLCIGLPSAFIAYGLIALEIRQRWTFPKALVKLGDASYSLYLWHQMLFAVMAAVWVKLGIAGGLPLRLVSIPIAIALGVASYRLIERPIYKSKWVARLAGTVRKPSIAPSASLVVDYSHQDAGAAPIKSG